MRVQELNGGDVLAMRAGPASLPTGIGKTTNTVPEYKTSTASHPGVRVVQESYNILVINLLWAIHLHVLEALLAQIQRLQAAHHAAFTPQQPGFILVEIAKFGAELIERQRDHIHAFHL